MAQIAIREKDLTGNPAASVFDVAFVPGLTINDLSDKKQKYSYGKPYYFNSLAQFQKAMGGKPVELTGVGIPYKLDEHKNIVECPSNGDESGFFFKGGPGQFDRGYVYAVELLTAGIPLYYLPVKGTSAIDVYNALGEGKYTISGPASHDVAVQDYPGTTGTYRITDTKAVSGWERADISIQGLSDVLGIKSIDDLEEITITYTATPGYDPVTISMNDITIETTLGDDGYISSFDITPVDGFTVDLTPDEEHSSSLEPIEDLTVDVTDFSLTFAYGQVTAVVNGIIVSRTTGDSQLLQLVDRGTFNIKYLTSGGYPVYEYDNNSVLDIMLQVAGAHNDETDDYKDDPNAEPSDARNGRGDCLALIDHFEIDERPLLGPGSVFERINSNDDEDSCRLTGKSFLSYGAMYTPYANYYLSKGYAYEYEVGDKKKYDKVNEMHFPGSFAYMTCLAKQLKAVLTTYESVAGVGRGTVTNIVFNSAMNAYEMCTDEVLTNYIANYYNIAMSADEDLNRGTISINAITQINPYGMVIYGTRTLAEKDPTEGVKATGVVNIRNMVSDIKKQMYQSARRYMFSANTDALWINFKSSVAGLLEQLQSGYGIKSWNLRKDPTKHSKYAIYALCTIVPVYPVEKFDITIEITDENISVNEQEN